jgi:hypothetical protein
LANCSFPTDELIWSGKLFDASTRIGFGRENVDISGADGRDKEDIISVDIIPALVRQPCKRRDAHPARDSPINESREPKLAGPDFRPGRRGLLSRENDQKM